MSIVYSPEHIAWAREMCGDSPDLMKAIQEIEDEQKVSNDGNKKQN